MCTCVCNPAVVTLASYQVPSSCSTPIYIFVCPYRFPSQPARSWLCSQTLARADFRFHSLQCFSGYIYILALNAFSVWSIHIAVRVSYWVIHTNWFGRALVILQNLYVHQNRQWWWKYGRTVASIIIVTHYGDNFNIQYNTRMWLLLFGYLCSMELCGGSKQEGKYIMVISNHTSTVQTQAFQCERAHLYSMLLLKHKQ